MSKTSYLSNVFPLDVKFTKSGKSTKKYSNTFGTTKNQTYSQENNLTQEKIWKIKSNRT